MEAPSASFVEAAVDSLKDPEFLRQHATILAAQDKEVRFALPGRDEVFYNGYALGMMTARILLLTMPLAVRYKVEL